MRSALARAMAIFSIIRARERADLAGWLVERIKTMGFVQRELGRVTAKLQAGPLPADEYGKFYAIQQALAWSLEPTGFRAPYDMVSSISFRARLSGRK